MRRIAGTAVLVAVGIVLVGCGAAPSGPDPRIEATPVAEVTCPEVYEDGYAEAGLVPDGFEAVAIVRCDPYASGEHDGGTWSGALRQRLTGDLQPVLDAFATPSDPPRDVCPAIGYLLPELWVEGADGTFVRVALPYAGCGPKDVGLDEALSALEVTAEEFVPGTLVESPEAAAAGCATQAGVLTIAGRDDLPLTDDVEPEQDHVISEPGLVEFEPPALVVPAEVTGARVCVYTPVRTEGLGPVPAGDGGLYAGVHRLGEVDARAVVDAATRAPSAEPCSETATRFVVVHPLTASEQAAAFTVELDGCRRLIDPSLRTLTATPDILALLEPPQSR